MKNKKLLAVLLAGACICVAGGVKTSGVSVTAATEQTKAGSDYAYTYDFTTMTSFDQLSDFKGGIDVYDRDDEILPEVDKETYPGKQWETYAREMSALFTLDGGLKVNTDNFLNEDASENKVYVRLDGKKMQYYKAELVYNYVDDVNGWAGLFFGYDNTARQPRWPDNPGGAEFFVQIEGKPTYSSYAMGVGEYAEDDPVSNWQMKGDHTLGLKVSPDEISLTVDGEEGISVSKSQMDANNFRLLCSNMGFFFTNAEFTVKQFSYSPLNAEGEYVAVTGLEASAPATVEQLGSITVTPVVSPANASLQTVGYELPVGASADGNKLTFTHAGTYTVKAYAIDNPEIYTEFTVTVTGSGTYITYPTDAEDVAKGFDHYYVTDASSKDGAPAPIEDYFTFNADGSMTLKEKKESAVDAGYSMLYMKDLVNGFPIASKNFEIAYMVKSSIETVNGWHGVAFAMDDRAGVPNQSGISVFMQEAARKATVWGGGGSFGIGGPYEADSAYTTDGNWNLIKIKVYGGNSSAIEIYVNDMGTPVLTQTVTGMPVGDVALFMTTNVTLANVSYARLDTSGNPVRTVYPESVEIVNAVTTALKGESMQLEVKVLPANVTNGDVVFESSNVMVATVNDTGLISFQNAGVVTVTVSCKANPAVKKALEITVSNPTVLPTSVSFDMIPTDAKVGGNDVLLVTVGPENATDYSVTFQSSNTSVATVDEEGRIEYVGAGETTITVICNADPSVKASFELTVKGEEKEESKKGGCSGVIAGGGALAAITALAAAACVKAISKKED